jgi:hypothetical protein
VNKRCTAKPMEGESTPQYTKKKNYMNNGLLKRTFQVKVSWQLKIRFRASTFSFHAGIKGDRLPEPYFLRPHLIGAVYRDFVRNVLPELLLQDVHLQTRIHLRFMQDGTPPHFLLAIQKFLEQWIGQGGQIAWSAAHSPDLNPLVCYV